jgi:Zn-dependent protease with chaperone function
LQLANSGRIGLNLPKFSVMSKKTMFAVITKEGGREMLESQKNRVLKIQLEMTQQFVPLRLVKFEGRRLKELPECPASMDDQGITIYLPAVKKMSVAQILTIIQHEFAHQWYRHSYTMKGE